MRAIWGPRLSWSVLIVPIAVAGCDYTSGTKVTAEQARQFTVGTSSMADVEARLGQPTSTTATSDGTRILIYQYDNTHQDATNYVPIIGLLASHSEQTSSRTTFSFGPTGTLKSYATTGGGSDLQQH